MKRFLFPALLLLFSSGYAQNGTSKKKLHFAAARYAGSQRGSIAGIDVVLASADSMSLGYLPAEQGNDAYQLTPPGATRRWLDTLVDSRYSAAYRPVGKKLIWVITDLFVTSDTSGTYNFTTLHADVYVIRGGERYAPLFSTDTVFLSRSAGSDSCAPAILAALDGLYGLSDSMLSAKGANLAAGEELDGALVKAAGAKTAAYPVIAAATMAKGGYLNFQEFISNTPSVTHPIWAEPDTIGAVGAVRFFMLGEDSAVTELKGLWGVCLGGNELYKIEKGRMLPMERSGDGFILSRYQDPVVRKNQGRYYRKVIGQGWPNKNNPFGRSETTTVSYRSARSSAGLAPVATRLDMRTGELKF